ncbi:MAG: PIG-L family deacetylase, partial [Acetobacteraceae bacterium]|nr:PIG-L family deacetylase [Acetobacteraceae bacterium]
PLKEAMESLKSISPDLVFTHHRHDGHQDHRTVAELTWNTFRNHLILEYEIPKYDPDLTNPNAFFPLTESEADRKVASLMTCFESQRDRRWFVPETFMALMRIRGMQAASPTGLAEGFHAPKFWILTDTLRHSNAWA